MILVDGTEAKNGDIISWNCWDNDDFTTWNFTGLVKPSGVVYLGGGVDFGMAIGAIQSIQEVIEESQNNDDDEKGITKVGTASEFAIYVGKFGAA